MKTFNKNSIYGEQCRTIVAAVVVSLVLGLAGPISTLAATTINLGAADSFAILAGASVTNVPTSVITGDLGLSPAAGSFYDSGITQAQVAGTIYSVDASGPAGRVTNPTLLTAAKQALTDAMTIAANAVPATTIDQDLGTFHGGTLSPGIYKSGSSIGLTGTVTLDGGGNPNAVFIFQAVSTITTASASVVKLTGGTQACNVFWEVGSSAAQLGTNSTFKGTIMSDQTITLLTGANVEGRLLAFTGSVILDHNTVTKPTCVSAATLHVIKLVAGGTAAASDFTVHVKNSSTSEVGGGPFLGAAAPGTLYSLSAGTYTISENANSSYAQTFNGFCPGGNVTLSAGQDLTCTITNTYIPLLASIVPSVGVSTGNGRIVPLIGILKIPDPLALPGGSGSTTYNYTVWNVGGQQALDNITVTDDKCSPVTYVSGDLNGNGKLDPHENWKYSCTTTLSKTTTNTAIATGYSDDAYHQAAIATAVATVVVGAPLTPPLINIVKVPSRLTPFPFGGGDVTYAYVVTNPGVVSMHDVTVVDDKCSPVSRNFNDANLNGNNNNNLLDPGESWSYTCRTNVPVSSMNVAEAEGSANGFTALGYAFATVLVATPGLPNTGFPPKGNGALGDIVDFIVALVGILTIALTSLTVALKKRKV